MQNMSDARAITLDEVLSSAQNMEKRMEINSKLQEMWFLCDMNKCIILFIDNMKLVQWDQLMV